MSQSFAWKKQLFDISIHLRVIQFWKTDLSWTFFPYPSKEIQSISYSTICRSLFLNLHNLTTDCYQRAVEWVGIMLCIISNHIVQNKCTVHWPHLAKNALHFNENTIITQKKRTCEWQIPQSSPCIIIYLLLSCQHHVLPQQCQQQFDVDGNRSQKRIVGLKRM